MCSLQSIRPFVPARLASVALMVSLCRQPASALVHGTPPVISAFMVPFNIADRCRSPSPTPLVTVPE